MILEEIRYVLEDIERLEQAVVDRLVEEPKLVQIRDRLNCQHEIAQLLDHMQAQSAEALRLYEAAQGPRADEVRLVGGGSSDEAGDAADAADPLAFFYRRCDTTLAHHARYPNEPIDQPELRYRSNQQKLLAKLQQQQQQQYAAAAAGEGAFGDNFLEDAEQALLQQPTPVDAMFSGEEGFGRYFDLNANYEAYINLPNVKRLSYLQYLDVFDNFAPAASTAAQSAAITSGGSGPRRSDKLTEAYFQYVGDLAAYLESFMRKTRPLENLDKVFAGFDSDFDALWEKDELPNWKLDAHPSGGGRPGEEGPGDEGDSAPQLSTADAVWCADCEKEFKNENVYKGHLNGRKHVRAAEQRAAAIAAAAALANGGSGDGSNGTANGATGPPPTSAAAAVRLRERAVAAREYRVQRLVAAMSTEKEDTRVNVERRQGMTERERQQELENLYNMTLQSSVAAQLREARKAGGKGGAGGDGNGDGDGDDEDDEDTARIDNPLKLPLSWDGKPIPFWLYRLHGLGVEYHCEICGQYTYMGRRAFEKHFNESRHVHGLRCLGINNPTLFRDITSIEEALRLWDKIQKERKKAKADESSIVQMEDAEGHVMPEKVYYDLKKQGLV